MVSTRQMSSIGGGSGSSDGAGPSHAETTTVARVTRHSSALLPGGSSPQASSKNALVPANKISYTTHFLDLPLEIVEKIFRYVGFKSISQLRMVNIFYFYFVPGVNENNNLMILTFEIKSLWTVTLPLNILLMKFVGTYL